MLSALRRLTGFVKVTEERGTITISGIPMRTMSIDIKRIWSTSKINTWMFINVGKHEVTLPSFFALDLVYMLTQIEQSPTRYSNPRAITRIRKALINETWLSRLQEPEGGILDFSRIKREMNVTLKEHQQEFLEAYDTLVPALNLNGYILAGAPGSGKTINSLAWAVSLNPDVVFIICPSNAVYEVWEETLKSRFKRPQDIWIAANNEAPRYNAKYYIFHYEALNRAQEIARKIRCRNPVTILDESHNLNELTSNRTNHYIDICNQLASKHNLWASGTPLKAMGVEVIPFLRANDPMFTPDVEERMLKIFGKNSVRANDILRHRLGLLTFKIPKERFRPNKPTYQDVLVKIPNGRDYTLEAVREQMRRYIEERMAYYEQHRGEYVEMFTRCLDIYARTIVMEAERRDYATYCQYVEMLEEGYDMSMSEQVKYCSKFERERILPKLDNEHKRLFRDAASVVKYVHLKVQGECLGRVVGGARAKCHLDMAEHIDFEAIIDPALKKTVIFTSYIEVVDKVYDRLKELDYRPIAVHSKTGMDLNDAVKLFRRDEDVNPIIATYKSLSTAVPLIEANTEICINPPFREYEMEQAVSRVDRMGQDAEVFIFNTFLDTGSEPNISTRTKDILAWSREQVESLMGYKMDDDVMASLEDFDSDSFLYLKGQRGRTSMRW